MQLGVAAGERGAVVEQHLAQAHERVVDVGDAGLLGLLVAEIDWMRSRRRLAVVTAAPPRPTCPSRWAMPSRLARRAPTTSTRLSFATSAPMAFTMVWVPPVPGSVFTTSDEPGLDLGDDLLLLGVGVEQQRVGRRRPLVLRDGRGALALLAIAARARPCCRRSRR